MTMCRIVVHTSLGNALPENGKNEIISFYTGLVEQNGSASAWC